MIGGLSAEAAADLEAMVQALSQDERRELARPDAAWPRMRPLLHLAAGGDAPSAYFELATTARAGDELVAARARRGGKGRSDLVASLREVVRRAAARWLRDRAVEVASPQKATVQMCDAIDRAARALSLTKVQRLARELAIELEPSAVRYLLLADTASRELDLEAARSALGQARERVTNDAERVAVAETESLLAAAELASAARGQTLDRARAVAAGRAHLRLGRRADAHSTIAPHAAAAASDLAVASVVALSNADQVVCPDLPPTAPHPLLCAVSWSQSAAVRKGAELLERAWSSRGGRDEEAIGAHLGFAHFVPWIYGTYLLSGPNPDPNAFLERFAKVRVALKDAVTTAPQFEGVVLFVDTLSALYDAARARKAGETFHVPKDAQAELEKRARALAKERPDHRFTQCGVLAVATALSQNEGVSELLALLPEEIQRDYAIQREVLRLWSAAGDANLKRLDEASAAIAGFLPKDSSSLANSKLVLLMAEARAVAIGGEKELDVLARISGQLVGPDLPPDIRLRAAIDRAGALSRAGKSAEAESVLEGVLGGEGFSPGSTENDLRAIAYGYLLVLRARAARGEDRAEYRKKLDGLDEAAGELTASIRLWQELWLAEIDRLAVEERCGTMKVCRDRAVRKPLSDAELTRRLGPVSAKVLKRGALAVGSLNLNFGFSSEEGLIPIVVFDPRLLAVELPR